MPQDSDLYAADGYSPPAPDPGPPALDGAETTSVKNRVLTILGSDAMAYGELVHRTTAAARELDGITTITAEQVREVIEIMSGENAFEEGYGS